MTSVFEPSAAKAHEQSERARAQRSNFLRNIKILQEDFVDER
jgi:hypothetical protein